jgi:hypothetical protein
MPDKLSNVRKSLKANVHSEEQARRLARIAFKTLAPEAAKMEKRLEDSHFAPSRLPGSFAVKPVRRERLP